MKLENLLEALKDISTHNQLYHRTNPQGLLKILKSEKIKGFKYDFKVKDNEIATARKSSFSKIDKGKMEAKELSRRATSVEFILFKDRIKGSNLTRGVTISPFSEVVSNAIFRSNKDFKELVGDKYKELIKDIIKTKIYKTTTSSYIKDVDLLKNDEEIKEIIKKYNIKFLRTFLAAINDLLLIKKFRSENREAEERIGINKPSDSIPLNKELFKINLLKDFEKEFERDLTMEQKLELIKLIRKHENLFVHNDVYTEFMK